MRSKSEKLGPLVLMLTALGGVACGGQETEPTWRLTWSDEFDAPAGAPADATKWNHELGGHGWGNQELQFYTERPENIAHDGMGRLAITARREDYLGAAFTSARITTRGKLEQRYGRFEARLKLPTGKGMWPAFWMLGNDIGRSARWPDCGEIDVMESRGATPWRVTGALHGPGFSGGNALIGGFETADRADLTADFHIYGVTWTPDEIQISIDGHAFHSVRRTRLPASGRWVYDHPFFLLLNVAVGGNFGGPPSEGTSFPQTLLADWVRVYQQVP